jgi:hypothetical protein
MPYFSLPNKSTVTGLSLVARSRARRDSAYHPTEPVTVRPAIGLWWKHSFCLN